jgi:hypothetical protein
MMQSFLLIPLLLGSLFLSGSTKPAVDLEKERAALLEQHKLAREAHFKRDAGALVASFATETIYVRDGRVETRTKADSLRRVSQYFAGAEFTEWDDLMPPVIRISPDGKMAWMIVRLKGKYTHTGANGEKSVEEFVCAWMSIYEKQGSKWMHVANASTFQP